MPLTPKSSPHVRQALAAVLNDLPRSTSLADAIGSAVKRYSRNDLDGPVRKALLKMQSAVRNNAGSIPTPEEAQSLAQRCSSERIRYARSGRQAPRTADPRAVDKAGCMASVLGCSYGEACALLHKLAELREDNV